MIEYHNTQKPHLLEVPIFVTIFRPTHKINLNNKIHREELLLHIKESGPSPRSGINVKNIKVFKMVADYDITDDPNNSLEHVIINGGNNN